MNQILVIRPYRHNDTWVFDDDDVGLIREPFVAGIPEMIDLLVRDIPRAEHAFRLLFSAEAFPDAQASVEWVREEAGGNWYRWTERDMEGWLCPALFKYFKVAPRRLFMRAEPLDHAGSSPRASNHLTVARADAEQLLALLEVGDVDLAVKMLRAALA